MIDRNDNTMNTIEFRRKFRVHPGLTNYPFTDRWTNDSDATTNRANGLSV